MGFFEHFHQFFGVGRIGIRLKIDAALVPFGVADNAAFGVARPGFGRGGEHVLQHFVFMRGVFVRPLFGEHQRGVGAVAGGPSLAFHQRGNHVLHPFGAAGNIVLLHQRHAAGVVAPHIAGKAQHLTHAFGFGHGVERLGHDKAGNGAVGERGHHVGRRHHAQFHFARLRVFLHHFEAVFAQNLLQHHVVYRIPKRNRHGFAAQTGDVGNIGRNRERGAGHMVPHHHFNRRGAAVARPNAHRRQ